MRRSAARLFDALARPLWPGEIVVDDSPLSQSEILADVPIVGYGAFPKTGLVSLDPKKQRWAVDETVFYEAAGADVDFQNRVA
ncbi:MAG TPA: hypothetical protein VH684_06385 [Xanthobacteraceae bacterium]|jgi:hypothetical protein